MSFSKEKSLYVRRGVVPGVEFALTVLIFIFLGKYLGDVISPLAAKIGIVFGAIFGFVFSIYRLIKQFE